MTRVGAVVVLGGKVGGAALTRRIAAAVVAASHAPDAPVVACGGRAWNGRVEADAILEGLVAGGVARGRVRRDRLSLTTVENLVEARALLARAGHAGARWVVVTCDWHLPRALAIADALGIEVEGFAASTPPRSLVADAVRGFRERALSALDRRLARRAA